jgi:hypothetical protein
LNVRFEKLSGALAMLDHLFMAPKQEAGPGEVVPHVEGVWLQA